MSLIVNLHAPDNVLIERYMGKRVDPITKGLTDEKNIVILTITLDVYHLIFDPPTDPHIMERLTEEEGGIEVNMHKKLKAYHCHSNALLQTYKHVMKAFCTDQPIQDLTTSGISNN